MANILFLNRRYAISPGETVLDCLLRHGVSVPSDCREGVCQTCLMRAVRGVPPASSQQGLRETQKVQNDFLACCCMPEEELEIVLPNDEESRVVTSVLSLESLTEDIVRLRLHRPQRYDYRAGQYLKLFNGEGVGRSYSLASVPKLDEFLELHIRLVPDGAVSSWVRELKPGEAVTIGYARGNCFYPPGQPDRPLLLIGSGSGLAPLYGILRDALSQRHRGPIELFHGGKTLQALYLTEELHKLNRRHENLTYTPCALKGGEGVLTGGVDEIALQRIGDLAGWRVFLCGNADMVNEAKLKVFLAGAAARDIHSDPFIRGQ